MIIDKYYAIRIFACKKLITAQNAQNGGNKFPKSYKAVVRRFKKSENGSANASVLLLYLIAVNGWPDVLIAASLKARNHFSLLKQSACFN